MIWKTWGGVCFHSSGSDCGLLTRNPPFGVQVFASVLERLKVMKHLRSLTLLSHFLREEQYLALLNMLFYARSFLPDFILVLFPGNLGPIYALSSITSPSASQQLEIKGLCTIYDVRYTRIFYYKSHVKDTSIQSFNASVCLSDGCLSSFMFQGRCNFSWICMSASEDAPPSAQAYVRRRECYKWACDKDKKKENQDNARFNV